MENVIFGTHLDAKGVSTALWLGEKLDRHIHPPFSSIAFLDTDQKLTSCFVFTDYNKANIDIHGYARNGLSRKKITTIIRYVFLQLECIRLTSKATVDQINLTSMLPRIGFEHEATLKDFFGIKKDALVFRLDRHVALDKWIR